MHVRPRRDHLVHALSTLPGSLRRLETVSQSDSQIKRRRTYRQFIGIAPVVELVVEINLRQLEVLLEGDDVLRVRGRAVHEYTDVNTAKVRENSMRGRIVHV